METRFAPLLKQWPRNAVWVDGPRPVLVLSKHELGHESVERLRSEMILACGDELVSCILSIKMMHIYFRFGDLTLDYRPHRGPFSGLVEAEYRPGKTDRVEALLRLSPPELGRFREYAANILRAPAKVLGRPHPLQLTEPDFTVREHQTLGSLDDNTFCDARLRHNCLTWLTTAPLGEGCEPLWRLLGMEATALEKEAHSYIIPFHHFLVRSASIERVPASVYWTTLPIAEATSRVRTNPTFGSDFYPFPPAAVARVAGA